jgi:hypothetical protein
VGQTASTCRVAVVTGDERVDDVIARVAARLRVIRGPLPAVEFDAVAHDIVLDVARFVLDWTERDTVRLGPPAVAAQVSTITARRW